MNVSNMNPRLPILMYHSVSDNASKAFQTWAVSPSLFHEHMRYLSDEGYEALTVSQLIDARQQGSLPSKAVVITFDDAYADFTTAAFPILNDFGFVATLYVATKFVGGTASWLKPEREDHREIMSWTQLREVVAQGVECGGHTHTHEMLDLLPLEDAREDIRTSKHILEEQLGMLIRTFAYPFGYKTKAVRDIVEDLGFDAACATWRGFLSSHDDVFDLPRLTVPGGMGVDDFASMLAGNIPSHCEPMYRSKTFIWRQLRRVQRAWRSL